MALMPRWLSGDCSRCKIGEPKHCQADSNAVSVLPSASFIRRASWCWMSRLRASTRSHGDLRALLQQDVVTLGLAALPPATLIAALGELPSVTDVRHDGRQVALVTANPAATLSAALALSARLGLTATEATMGHRDLQALFFQLTGKALRDDGVDRDAA